MHSLAIIPMYREPEKAGAVLKRFEPGLVDEICVVVDNPDEQMTTEIRNALNEVEVPVSIINNPERKGMIPASGVPPGVVAMLSFLA